SNHTSRTGKPENNKPGKNTADPSKVAHQVAIYFSPACLSKRFQVVCKKAEQNSKEIANMDMRVLVIEIA
ncbi:MAG: hypothetical protein NTW32_02380, partial [Chloroflexi bacterium]|nr:hypothetical protein [Chloroflexota bacterium]